MGISWCKKKCYSILHKKNWFITYKKLKIQGKKLTMRQEIMFSLYWYCSSSAFLKKFACGTFLILFLVFLIWNFYVLFQNFIFLCILVSEFKREGESPKIKQQKREKPSKKRETIKKERKRLVTQILWEKKPNLILLYFSWWEKYHWGVFKFLYCRKK
jgi:hypothetical protein